MGVTLQSGVVDLNTQAMLKYYIQLIPHPEMVELNRGCSCNDCKTTGAHFTSASGG